MSLSRALWLPGRGSTSASAPFAGVGSRDAMPQLAGPHHMAPWESGRNVSLHPLGRVVEKTWGPRLCPTGRSPGPLGEFAGSIYQVQTDRYCRRAHPTDGAKRALLPDSSGWPGLPAALGSACCLCPSGATPGCALFRAVESPVFFWLPFTMFPSFFLSCSLVFCFTVFCFYCGKTCDMGRSSHSCS